MSSAYGHTTIYLEQYEIEAGWGDEPPVVNLPNKIVIEVAESAKTMMMINLNLIFKFFQINMVNNDINGILKVLTHSKLLENMIN